MQILFVGCGNMGGAIVSGMLQSCNFQKSEISAILPDIEADIQKTKERYGIQVYTNYPTDKKFDAILLAVKPQTLPEILPIYRAALINLETIVISIAAGKTTNYLASFFSSPVIRTMPNINALAGKGVTVGYTNKSLTSSQRELVEKVFTSVGKFSWVEDEALLDAVTAISGSGPAYFFHFVEHLITAGIGLGLPEDLATTLAIETFTGSAALLEAKHETLENLRKSVTSPNGTTAAALDSFNKDNMFKNLIANAVKAAHKRANELSQ